MRYDLTPTVAAMKDLHLEGNIIPMEWFSHITFDNGRPDTNAILILSDIVYWYRPTVVRDERTGLVVGYRKKFKADLLQKNYQDYETLFGLSKKQIRDAFVRLEEIGIIRRVLRTVETAFGVQNNVLFIDLFPEKVRMFTQKALQGSPFSLENNAAHPPVDIEIGSSLHESQEVLTLKSTPLDVEVKTYTKITPEITAKITPPVRGNVSNSMLEIWNKTLHPSLPVQMIPARCSRLREVLIRQFQGELAHWESFCSEIARSPFLMGQGQRGWRVSLDWILEPRNLQKTLEGNYHSGEGVSPLTDPSPSLAEMRLKAQQHIENLKDPLFQKFSGVLLRYLPEAKYLRWFEGIEMAEWQDSRLILFFSSKAVRDYVERHFSSEIGAAARSVSPDIQRIDYELRASPLVSSSYSSERTALDPEHDCSSQTLLPDLTPRSGNSVAEGLLNPQQPVLHRQENASAQASLGESSLSHMPDDRPAVNLPEQGEALCLQETHESLSERRISPQQSREPADGSTGFPVAVSSPLAAERHGEYFPADVLYPESLIKKACDQPSDFRDKHFSMEFYSDVSAHASPRRQETAQNMAYHTCEDEGDHGKTTYRTMTLSSPSLQERSLP